MSLLETIAVIVGVVSGIAGCVLGGLSLLHQWLTTRPRIRIRLHDASGFLPPETPQEGKNVVVVEVCNVGQVSVMILGVIKFLLPEHGEKKPQLKFPLRLARDDEVQGEPKFQVELMPQRVVYLRFDYGPGDLPEGRKLGRAYVMSAVDDTFKASRRAMRDFAKSRARLKREAAAH